MSDWTYEMLRYAFSWNAESADKALKYVVNSRSGTESLSEFQLLDILLLTILTEKDEVERTCALIFLEEHGNSLVFDYTRLHKVYFVLDNILGSPVDGQSMTYSLKSQVLVTYTALLIQFNCFQTDVARFEGFVDLLHSIVKHTNRSADRILRSYACECLHELESWYPGLLFPLLGEDWSVAPLYSSTSQGSVGSNTLGKFVNDELLHIHESYARLFFTTFQHFTEQVVQDALAHAPVSDGAINMTGSLSMRATPQESRAGTPPMTPRASLHGGVGGTGSSMTASMNTTSEVLRFRIPENCKAGPEVAFDLAADQTPPRLPRKLVRTMTRSISLVLETMPTSSSWTKIFIAERLSLFIRVLALPCRVVFHHFSPLLHASRPSLLHAFLVVTSLFAKEIDHSVSEAIVDRLFALTQDIAVEPCFRLLAVNWLVALSNQKDLMFELLWNRVPELCPTWHDPLELKEMKLQALLHCFKLASTLPSNLLIVLEALSEFKYCIRPVGAQAVVFRFLLRVVINFAPEMDRLSVTQCLCDLLRSHPRLLPSMLSIERWTNSKAVQYKLLRSLGEFVSKLEPPSRIQYYFGLLVILSQTPWLDPSYVIIALRRLVFSPSSHLTWRMGMRVLITCRQVMLYHPQSLIYKPLLRLLHHLATYQDCVDLRDRALLYLKLLTHAGSASLGTLLQVNAGDVDQMMQMLTPVLPKTVKLVNGPVPFLTFFKSPVERVKLGILDERCAVFVLPVASVCRTEEKAEVQKAADPSVPTYIADDWQVQWGDSGEDHCFPAHWLERAENGFSEEGVGSDRLTEFLSEYMSHVHSHPASIRLPFVLKYQEVKEGSEALEWLDFPQQLFSIELTFTSSEHFVPIDPIRIPFISKDDAPSSPAGSKQLDGFPCMNRLLLRLQPINPVPTSFGVNIAFNDCSGHMYFGQLETFDVAFEDLFLPVRLPLKIWPHLFERLWKGGLAESCWTVKVLDRERESVGELISSKLGPFIVHSNVCLEEEDFDFEQEEYFENESSEVQVAAVDGGVASEEDGDSTASYGMVPHVDTVCVIIFIPPASHLLMRFAISSHTTVVRVLTDRFQLLSYMDTFFLSWSMPMEPPPKST